MHQDGIGGLIEQLNRAHQARLLGQCARAEADAVVSQTQILYKGGGEGAGALCTSDRKDRMVFIPLLLARRN